MTMVTMNETDPVISIIIPVYNAENYLQRCVESVLAQTYENYEILLINNGSTDGSLQLCRELARRDSRITVIDTDEKGVSNARNVGLSRYKGSYFTFADADDWLEKDAFEKLILTIENSGADVVLCDYYMSEDQSKLVTTEMASEQIISGIQKENVIENSNTGFILPYVWRYFYRRTEETDRIRFHKELSLAEDTLFNLEILVAAKSIYKVNQAFYHYIAHPTSVMNSYKPNYIEQLEKQYEIKKDFAIKNNMEKYIDDLQRDYVVNMLAELVWNLRNYPSPVKAGVIRSELKKIASTQMMKESLHNCRIGMSSINNGRTYKYIYGAFINKLYLLSALLIYHKRQNKQ